MQTATSFLVPVTDANFWKISYVSVFGANNYILAASGMENLRKSIDDVDFSTHEDFETLALHNNDVKPSQRLKDN